MSGILRKSDERALAAEVVAGAGLWVQMSLDEGALDAAAQQLDRFEAKLGAQPPLQAMRAEWLRRSGDASGGWSTLSAALADAPGDPHLLQLASRWAVTMPDDVPADVAAQLQQSGSWEDAWNLALSQRKAGDAAACHATAVDALDRTAGGVSPDVQRKLAGLGHRCAVAARDLTGADARWRAGGAAALDAVVTYNHAHLRFASGDVSGTLTYLVTGSQPLRRPTRRAPAMVALALRAQLDLDALDAAHTLAVGAWATPEDQLVVASRLAVAGDDDRARALLTRACPALSGDARTRCDKLSQTVGVGGAPTE